MQVDFITDLLSYAITLTSVHLYKLKLLNDIQNRPIMGFQISISSQLWTSKMELESIHSVSHSNLNYKSKSLICTEKKIVTDFISSSSPVGFFIKSDRGAITLRAERRSFRRDIWTLYQLEKWISLYFLPDSRRVARERVI